jgi:dCTP deaminase
VEIVPQTFPIYVKEGTKLNQIRFFRGEPERDDEQLRLLSRRGKLIYKENGDAPTEILIEDGLRISVDLEGSEQDNIVAYKAKRGCAPINLATVGTYDVEEYWEPIRALNPKSLVLNPNDFYLLASKQRVGVPPGYAAEMEQYDSSIGEFTVHYAGFFDPGFGYGTRGEIKGTKAVLEVRAHEVPILLEDGQEVGRMTYLKMADRPIELYGQNIGSSYQGQGLALSKQFKKPRTESIPTSLATHS